jgi:hypothetical protein
LGNTAYIVSDRVMNRTAMVYVSFHKFNKLNIFSLAKRRI